MSYDALERSVAGGAPAELYRFVRGNLDTGVDHPITGAPIPYPADVSPPPGRMIVSFDPSDWRCLAVNYDHAMPLGVAPGCTTDPPSSYAPTGFGVLCGRYVGEISGHGHVYSVMAVTPDIPLLPNHAYILRVLQGHGADSNPIGLRIPAPWGSGEAYGTNADAATFHDLQYVDHPLTTDDAGNFVFHYGMFDTVAGSVNLVACIAAALYDPALPSDDSDTGGDPAGPTVECFTSADQPITYQGEVYAPTVLTRGPLRFGGAEPRDGSLTLTVPRDSAVASLAPPPPSPPVAVTVHRVHRSDAGGAVTDPGVTLLRGQVGGLDGDGASARLTLLPAGALLERELPQLVTQRSCPHQLYGPVCRADRLGHTVAGLEVTAVAGRHVTIAGAGAAAVDHPARFVFGVLELPSGARGLIEAVDATDGDLLTLQAAVPGLEAGAIVTLIDGCDKAPATCDGLFANARNFGGESVMSIRNPGTGAGLN